MSDDGESDSTNTQYVFCEGRAGLENCFEKLLRF